MACSGHRGHGVAGDTGDDDTARTAGVEVDIVGAGGGDGDHLQHSRRNRLRIEYPALSTMAIVASQRRASTSAFSSGVLPRGSQAGRRTSAMIDSGARGRRCGSHDSSFRARFEHARCVDPAAVQPRNRPEIGTRESSAKANSTDGEWGSRATSCRYNNGRPGAHHAFNCRKQRLRRLLQRSARNRRWHAAVGRMHP